MSKWCEILDCICVTNLPSCIACDYYKRREIIKNADDINYGVGEFSHCDKFGTEFPIDVVCLTLCPRGVRNSCTDAFINLQKAEKEAAAKVFVSQHQVKFNSQQRKSEK